MPLIIVDKTSKNIKVDSIVNFSYAKHHEILDTTYDLRKNSNIIFNDENNVNKIIDIRMDLHDYEEDYDYFLVSTYRCALRQIDILNVRKVIIPLVGSKIYHTKDNEIYYKVNQILSSYLYDSEYLVENTIYLYIIEPLSNLDDYDCLDYLDENYLNFINEESKTSAVFNKMIIIDEAPRDSSDDYEIEIQSTNLFSKVDKNELILNQILKKHEMSFVETLFQIIDSQKLTDSFVYKKANIDRKTFSKIRCSKSDYIPKKKTVIAFCIALELDLEQTESLLNKAGYTLSKSYRFDNIIRYFIELCEYDIYTINSYLYRFGEDLLGIN